MCQVATFDAAQAQTLPTRAERRRVRGRTRARARDCSSRASWELCSRALTARAAGACLFPGWKTGAASARPRLPGQAVAERHRVDFNGSIAVLTSANDGQLNTRADRITGQLELRTGRLHVTSTQVSVSPPPRASQMASGSQRAPEGHKRAGGSALVRAMHCTYLSSPRKKQEEEQRGPA